MANLKGLHDPRYQYHIVYYGMHSIPGRKAPCVPVPRAMLCTLSLHTICKGMAKGKGT